MWVSRLGLQSTVTSRSSMRSTRLIVKTGIRKDLSWLRVSLKLSRGIDVDGLCLSVLRARLFLKKAVTEWRDPRVKSHQASEFVSLLHASCHSSVNELRQCEASNLSRVAMQRHGWELNPQPSRYKAELFPLSHDVNRLLILSDWGHKHIDIAFRKTLSTQP